MKSNSSNWFVDRQRPLCAMVVVVLVLSTASDARCEDVPPTAPDRATAEPIPTKWTDPATGFKLVRLSRLPATSMSFYFHNNPFVPGEKGEADKMVFYSRTDAGMQLFVMDLKTLKTEQLTDRPFVRGEIVCPKLREAFYQSRNEIYAVNVDTRIERHVATLPNDLSGGISTVNSDGTLLVGTYSKGRRTIFQRTSGQKADYFNRIFEANLPSQLFTVDVQTGKATVIHEEIAWLNHLQFSPTNPNQLMFCHEGPWHKVDRIWLIDVNTRKVQQIHKRSVDREIAGHEFWAPDGKTIWFDLQVPRGETFFLAGYDVTSNHETRYALTRNEWSVHYNISTDQKLFCGDGGGSSSVAHADDGKWIYLFKPDGTKLQATRLVNLEKHDYDLEPNAHFSPDGRRIIFRSNMHGVPQIYAVILK